MHGFDFCEQPPTSVSGISPQNAGMKLSRHHNKHTNRFLSFYVGYIHNFYSTMLSDVWAFKLVGQSFDKNKWRVGGSPIAPDPNFLDLSKTCCGEVFQT